MKQQVSLGTLANRMMAKSRLSGSVAMAGVANLFLAEGLHWPMVSCIDYRVQEGMTNF